MEHKLIPLLRLDYTVEEIKFIKDEIEEVLRSGYLTMSNKVKLFEEMFANFCNVKYALGTNSGTSSLEIALRTIGVENGTVVMPSNTYMATPLAAIKAGAKIIFTDCEKENLQMDPDDLKRKIRDDTKAVVIVHIGGIISPRLNEIQEICQKYNIPLVEDAAHAHGAEYKGIKAGNLGDIASFSFYPTKVFTTAEGGMMVTNNEAIYKKGIVLREHGKSDHNYNIHTEVGDNWRFSEIHAVLGIQQMNKANYIISERRRLAHLYDKLLEGYSGVRLLLIPDHVNPVYYKYIIFLPDEISREKVKSVLKNEFRISLTGEVYSNPCHSQPVFDKYPFLKVNKYDDNFTNTDYVCKHHACLPLYPGLLDEEVKYVVNSLKKVLA